MTSPQEKKSNCYMIRNFRIYRVLFRVFGTFFVKGLDEQSHLRTRRMLRNPYTLYSIAWLLNICFFEGGRTVKDVIRLYYNLKLTHVAAAILHAATFANIAVNFACMLIGTKHLLAFFQECSHYEKCTAFRPPAFCEAWRRDRKLRLLRIAAMTKTILAYNAFMYMFYGSRGRRRHWNVFLKVVSAFSFTGYSLCELLMYLTVRSTCEVLVWYVRAQRLAFEECLKEVAEGVNDSAETPDLKDPAALKIELVRLNMCKIRQLKSRINSVWSPALAMTAVTVLLGTCVTLYEVLTLKSFSFAMIVMFLHVSQIALRFLELVFISQSLRDEAQKLKGAAEAAFTAQAKDSYFKQVQFLQESIDPEDMCISGAGFFRLGRPLVLSMMGALITYTVILAQTGEHLQRSQRHDTHHTATNSTHEAL